MLQDTYLRAFRSLKRFRGEAEISTWLHRITVNCSKSLLKRRGRTQHARLDDEADLPEGRTERNPDAAAAIADDRVRIVAALETLPVSLRLVVVLRDVYDMSHAEIARELSISQAAAKVRLHRARRRLRDELFPATPGSADEASGPATVTDLGTGAYGHLEEASSAAHL